MLKCLFGSKDKEMILQYLLVRESGYSTEIAKFWDVNVPQINRQLISLKEDGILKCKAFGKTLVYYFNNDCSFVNELKALLLKVKNSYQNNMLLKIKELETKKVKEKTSAKSGYYSGTIALNLFPDDANGDWHSSIAFNALKSGKSKSPYFIMGRQGRLSTRKYFENKGIIKIQNIENIKNTLGVEKVARPFRAVADMVLISILSGKRTDYIQYKDWIVTNQERKNFKELLEKSLKKMNFIEKEKVNAWMKTHL